MTDYHIYGRPFAGSLIAEFLLTAADCPYTISFPDETERKTAQFLAKNPTGRIPVLVCPEGHSIFESLAIVHHITERFDGLAPTACGADRDRYLSLITLMFGAGRVPPPSNGNKVWLPLTHPPPTTRRRGRVKKES